MRGVKHLLDRLNKIKDAVDNVPNEMDSKMDSYAQRAKSGYSAFGYAGSGSIDVSSGRQDPQTWEIVASGETLLFVEFGTGIIYPHDNPIESDVNYAGSWSIEHGQYLTDSEKLAKYRGGWPLANGVIVYGNPSANVMYQTGKNIDQNLAVELKRYLEKAVK